MRKFAFVSLIAMLFVAFSAKAQDYEVKPPTEDKVAVGAIGGTVDVTALGGASYSIPIQVPEGMGGMQPNLAISYNNQGGNGLLGWCWDLGGLSIITRTGTTWYHDNCLHGVCFSTDFSDCDGLDRFALDGQRLMVVNGRPDGADGAEYRTEVDQMAKIESYSCDTTFGPAPITEANGIRGSGYSSATTCVFGFWTALLTEMATICPTSIAVAMPTIS